MTTDHFNLMLTNLRAFENHLNIVHDSMNLHYDSEYADKILHMRHCLAGLEADLQFLQYWIERKKAMVEEKNYVTKKWVDSK
jgi:hypothetical protein